MSNTAGADTLPSVPEQEASTAAMARTAPCAIHVGELLSISVGLASGRLGA